MVTLVGGIFIRNETRLAVKKNISILFGSDGELQLKIFLFLNPPCVSIYVLYPCTVHTYKVVTCAKNANSDRRNCIRELETVKELVAVSLPPPASLSSRPVCDSHQIF